MCVKLNKMCKKSAFLICLGLLTIGFVIGDSELQPDDANPIKNEG